MNDSTHPLLLLDEKYVTLLRNEAQKAEKEGKLTKSQLNLIYEQNWFKILVPAAYGGGEYSLPDALQLEEALAWADGSTGWLVTLCAGAGWFGGFTNPEFSKKIFSDPKVCIAGSGTATGTAEKTKDGYMVNGEWGHASGSKEATYFTGNCVLTQNGKPILDDKNKKQILSFLFAKNEVTIIDTWNTIGMQATASDSYKVVNLKVKEDRTFKINTTTLKVGGPLYNYPFQQLAEATLAVNISGMALHFIDLYKGIIDTKKIKSGPLFNEPAVEDTFEKYTSRLTDARTKLYYAVALSWQASLNSKQIKEAILYKVSSGAFELAKRARECVDALYPYCGLSAADKDCEINRVWRDLHTASQHKLLVFGGYSE
jgi:alkylation response protein AidB-like acyl-CoA dehydrogenase